MGGDDTPAYAFKPDERPLILGGTFNPSHPTSRLLAYFAIGILTAITAGLGNALISVNLPYIQGALGLYNDEGAWLSVAFVMTNVCANLLLVRVRIQFGVESFVKWLLAIYAALILANLFVSDFWMAVLARAASGLAGASLNTICVLTLMQAMPAAKRPVGILLGVAIPQLAIPLARVISPPLLDWGDWRMAYLVELGLALATLAALLAVPLPPSERAKAFEPKDALSIALLFPGIALLCAVFGLGKIVWWTDAPWIGWALVGAIVFLAAGFAVESRRTNPLIQTGFLSTYAIARLGFAAAAVRILTSEQTFGSIGLLSALGMGPDQFRTLYVIILLASIAGLVTSILTFKPDQPARAIRIACALIAIGAFMDAGSTNLARPANLYVSQALIGFGALMFVGPVFLTGIARMMLAGPQNFVSWIILYSATQNLGGLIGSAMFGTLQTWREKFHSNDIVGQIVLTNPVDVQRLQILNAGLFPTITDPAQRNAEAAALLAQQASREANVLAFNDVFFVIGCIAVAALMMGIVIQVGMYRRGEPSPVRLFMQKLAASAAKPDRTRIA